MNYSINQYIHQRLQQRKAENNFRSMRLTNHLIDFYSNDYLGFARDEVLKERIHAEIEAHSAFPIGSTGSRLLSGNTLYAEQLENFIADFHHAEASLLFNSGFDANYGLISALPYRNDTIIYDELIHASVHDGIRGGKTRSIAFRHNDLHDLEKQLNNALGLKYVVVESVYSMDGDLAPLEAIAELCERYDAGLIVDEAHATGIFGKNGEGRVVELGLENKCLARIHTFGKAMGCMGAVVLGSKQLIQFLVNYSRPFIFSTAPSFHHLAAIKCAYGFLNESNEKRKNLLHLSHFFEERFHHHNNYRLIKSESPVRSIVVTGNQPVKDFAQRLEANGYDVRPILYPTVAKGKERIRICLHSYNTLEEVEGFLEAINTQYAAVSE